MLGAENFDGLKEAFRAENNVGCISGRNTKGSDASRGFSCTPLFAGEYQVSITTGSLRVYNTRLQFICALHANFLSCSLVLFQNSGTKEV